MKMNIASFVQDAPLIFVIWIYLLFYLIYMSNIFFTMYLECYWTSSKMHKKVSKWIKQSKRCIIKRSYVHHIDLSRYVSDCTVAYLT
jgi:hypothetical protein